jgi:hypothetical protein
VLGREDFVEDRVSVHAIAEFDLNVRDSPRERQSVPVVGPFREIDGQDLFKLWIGHSVS